MKQIKGFFLHRATVSILIGLIFITTLLSLVLPQGFSQPAWRIEKWRNTYPAWSDSITALGLDHIFTTPIFLFILGLFFVSLLFSFIRQLQIAQARIFALPVLSNAYDRGRTANKRKQSARSMCEVRQICRKKAYLQVAQNDKASLFVKHPWGYWGNAILHGSIMLIVAASLVILLFQQRGEVRLVQGGSFGMEDHWLVDEHGLLAGILRLPFTVRLDDIVPEYWPNDDLKALTSVLAIKYPRKDSVQTTLTITQSRYFSGIRLFQSGNYGLACSLTISRQGNRGAAAGLDYYEDIAIFFHNAYKRDKPQYEEMDIAGGRLLQAKYFPDAARKSMLSASPLIILRLPMMSASTPLSERPSAMPEELKLQPGQSGVLGSYTIRFNGAARWVGIIFIRMYAMPFIFLGFIMLAVGAFLIFFCPPRRLIVERVADGITFNWSASKFARFYEDERTELLARLLSNTCSEKI
jgi:hypothetical protein